MSKTLSQFLEAPAQAITLMGMSGVGKTYLSSLLEDDGWRRISCDQEIANTYLTDHLKSIMQDADDIDELARFVGLVGNPAQGGLPLEIFRQRQQLYYEAECKSVRDATAIISNAQPTIIDSTGSLCEIEDESLIEELGHKSLFVYLRASEEEQKAVLDRAQTNPKPLFYPPSTFPEWLETYMKAQNLDTPEEINPKDFARDVFPKLFSSRLPKYQALADKYGLTIPTASLRRVKSAEDFLTVIREAIP